MGNNTNEMKATNVTARIHALCDALAAEQLTQVEITFSGRNSEGGGDAIQVTCACGHDMTIDDPYDSDNPLIASLRDLPYWLDYSFDDELLVAGILVIDIARKTIIADCSVLQQFFLDLSDFETPRALEASSNRKECDTQ